MKEEVVERKLRRVAVSVILIVFLVGLSFAVYMTFFFTQKCETFECFSGKLINCENGYRYVNDDREATWLYEIKGEKNGLCVINVEMLQAKEGELGLKKLEGLEMDCSYGLGKIVYPEKDLTKCHGILKEEIQSLIIKKLHTYLLENLGDFSEELSTL